MLVLTMLRSASSRCSSIEFTGYYPRLTLATGQHFASKGGYLVRFVDGEGPRVVAEQDWTVP